MSIIYCDANVEDDNKLLEMARIHESAPLNWNLDYKIREERLKFWVGLFKENINEEEVKYILAKDDNKIVGLHWIKISERYNIRCAKIDYLWVHDGYRKKGIGVEIKKQGFEARQVETIKDLK